MSVEAVVLQHYLLALQAAQAQSEEVAVVAGRVGRVDQACQGCMWRDGPTMLLCDECDDSDNGYSYEVPGWWNRWN